MPFYSDYEFKLDLYHNCYVTYQQVMNGLKEAESAGNQQMMAFYQKIAPKITVSEAKVFQEGVEAAGGDAKKFLTDVLKNYSDMKDSPHFNNRLLDSGLTEVDLNLEAAHKMSIGASPKLAVTQAAIAVVAFIADYKQAFEYISNRSFNYLTEEAKSEYVHVYASAKLLLNTTMGLKPEFGYFGFRDWAVKVNLHEEDWVKLDPTPVTQNYINNGLPVRGIQDSLQNLESLI